MEDYRILPVNEAYNDQILRIMEAAPIHARGLGIRFDKSPEAEHIQISGSIQKFYCNGKKSGYFTFSHNLYPGDYSFEEQEAGLFLSQPYQYKFQNDLDKLLVIYTCKAWFNDGKIFESHTWPQEFFYKDVKFEANQTKHYILLDQMMSGTQWREVTQ